jgi:hypothetical protein
MCRYTSTGHDSDKADVYAGEDDITDEEADKPSCLFGTAAYKCQCCMDQDGTYLETMSIQRPEHDTEVNTPLSPR